jgi:hypothetical protein
MADRTIMRPRQSTSYGSRLRKGSAQRALALWPRLDRRALSRCDGDPQRIARLVARRTTLDQRTVWAILIGVTELDRELWFG